MASVKILITETPRYISETRYTLDWNWEAWDGGTLVASGKDLYDPTTAQILAQHALLKHLVGDVAVEVKEMSEDDYAGLPGVLDW